MRDVLLGGYTEGGVFQEASASGFGGDDDGRGVVGGGSCGGDVGRLRYEDEGGEGGGDGGGDGGGARGVTWNMSRAMKRGVRGKGTTAEDTHFRKNDEDARYAEDAGGACDGVDEESEEDEDVDEDEDEEGLPHQQPQCLAVVSARLGRARSIPTTHVYAQLKVRPRQIRAFYW